MATQSVLIAQDTSTDAAWRVWGLAIHNALVALGTLVQTADTGQANWATATRAGTAYEMWRFNDALQSTAPVYIKFLFGTSGSQPQLTIQATTGTNGAGTLTGNGTFAWAANLTFTATAQQYYFSSTTSRLTMWMEADASHGAGGNGAIWTFERPHDNAGAETGTGIVGAFAWNGTSTYQVAWGRQGASLPAFVGINMSDAAIVDQQATLIGSQMTAFTLNPVGVNHQVQNPLLGMLLYWSSDLGVGVPGTIPTVTIYGTAHTYINTNASPSSFAINANYRAMMLYE